MCFIKENKLTRTEAFCSTAVFLIARVEDQITLTLAQKWSLAVISVN